MHKATKGEVAQRVDEVVGLLGLGQHRRDILRYAAQEWGISERQGDEYIARGYDCIGRTVAVEREKRVGQSIARLNMLWSEAVGCIQAADKVGQTLDAIRTALAVDAEQRKLLGVNAAIEVKHEIADPWREFYVENGIKVPGNGKDEGTCASQDVH